MIILLDCLNMPALRAARRPETPSGNVEAACARISGEGVTGWFAGKRELRPLPIEKRDRPAHIYGSFSVRANDAMVARCDC
jgi:hypothetical protein